MIQNDRQRMVELLIHSVVTVKVVIAGATTDDTLIERMIKEQP